MTLVKIYDLRQKMHQARDEEWGYIYGARGQVWTQAQQDKATRAQTIQYGQQWVGKNVADCSGLYVWAFAECGGEIYHGSNTIFNKYCSETGPLVGDVQLRIGTAVFQNVAGKRTHIGWYDGNGQVIEERGTQRGLIVSPISVWDEWGVLKDGDYSGVPWETVTVVTPQTTRLGDSGELVEFIQDTLMALGYDIGAKVDGIFGKATEHAVKQFQRDRGLAADGVVGPKTWPVLRATDDDEPDNDTESPLPEESAPAAEDLAADVEVALENLTAAVRALLACVQQGGE